MAAPLHSILDTHPDLICRYTPDHVFTYANRAAAEFFRTTKDDLIGSTLIDRVPEDQKQEVQNRLDGLSISEPAVTSLHQVRRGGGPFWVLWTNIALFDEDDKLTGYQSIGRNVTTETLMREEIGAQARSLAAMQAELRAVLDHVPSRIWYKDDKNNILRLNQAAAESMGMAVGEVEGKNTYDLYGEAAKAYHMDDLAVLKSGVPMRGKVEVYTPNDGEQGWVATDKIPLSDIDDKSPRLLVVSTDVTALKEQEAMLKSINKNLDDFASLTSHDLQAPLRKIGISAELMEMEFDEQLPDGAKDYLRDIGDGVTHMRNMIRSFLRFMRQSPSNVELETVDLGALLRSVANAEHQSLQEAGGTLVLPDQDVFVAGDPALLTQVFANLIQNAVKYSHPDRPVHIRIEIEPDHQYWAVNIIDNGVGIDPAHREKVFDLFSRSKPKEDQEGSGIGLALCRRIVTLHGGTIGLVPEYEEGSHFRLTLYRRKGSTAESK